MENRQSLGIPYAKYIDSVKWFTVSEKLYLRDSKVDFNGSTFENLIIPSTVLPDTLKKIDDATPGIVGQVLTIKTVSPYELEWKTPVISPTPSTFYYSVAYAAGWSGGVGSTAITFRYYYIDRLNLFELNRLTFTSGGGVLRVGPLYDLKIPTANNKIIAIRINDNSTWKDGNIEFAIIGGLTYIYFHTNTSASGEGVGTWTNGTPGEIPGLRILYISSV